MPTTSRPLFLASIVAELMALLMPGAGPPPTRIPSRPCPVLIARVLPVADPGGTDTGLSCRLQEWEAALARATLRGPPKEPASEACRKGKGCRTETAPCGAGGAFRFWWSWGDSTPLPFVCQTNALPIELQP